MIFKKLPFVYLLLCLTSSALLSQTQINGIYLSQSYYLDDSTRIPHPNERLILYSNFKYDYRFPGGLAGGPYDSFGDWEFVNDSLIVLNSYFTTQLSCEVEARHNPGINGFTFFISILNGDPDGIRSSTCDIKINDDDGYIWSNDLGSFTGEKGKPDSITSVQLLYYKTGPPLKSKVFLIDTDQVNSIVIFSQLPQNIDFVIHEQYECRLTSDGIILGRIVVGNNRVIDERKLYKN